MENKTTARSQAIQQTVFQNSFRLTILCAVQSPRTPYERVSCLTGYAKSPVNLAKLVDVCVSVHFAAVLGGDAEVVLIVAEYGQASPLRPSEGALVVAIDDIFPH